MQSAIKDIVLSILQIIEYPNDKKAFIVEFENLACEETLLNVLKRLPSEVKGAILVSVDKEEALKLIPKEVYLSEFVTVLHQSLASFIEEILPTLTADQRERIRVLVFL